MISSYSILWLEELWSYTVCQHVHHFYFPVRSYSKKDKGTGHLSVDSRWERGMPLSSRVTGIRGPTLLTSKIALQVCLNDDPTAISTHPDKMTRDKWRNKTRTQHLYNTIHFFHHVYIYRRNTDPNIQLHSLQNNFTTSSNNNSAT